MIAAVSQAIIDDPVTRRALKINWPVIWRFILSLLPALLPLLLAQRERHAPLVGGLAGATPEEYPEFLRRAIAEEAASPTGD